MPEVYWGSICEGQRWRMYKWGEPSRYDAGLTPVQGAGRKDWVGRTLHGSTILRKPHSD